MKPGHGVQLTTARHYLVSEDESSYKEISLEEKALLNGLKEVRSDPEIHLVAQANGRSGLYVTTRGPMATQTIEEYNSSDTGDPNYKALFIAVPFENIDALDDFIAKLQEAREKLLDTPDPTT